MEKPRSSRHSLLLQLSRNEISRIKRLDIAVGNDMISPQETMKWKGDNSNYFFHSKSAINLVDSVLSLVSRDKSSIQEVLDFPCGHGRVLRSLVAYFPESRVYACDLDRAGVDFCASTLGAVGLYSSEDLDKVEIEAGADLIWCGSLLTHINSDKWPSFFDFFDRVLNSEGILIFTYAGSFVAELVRQGDRPFINDLEADKCLRDYDRHGFGYMQYSTHRNEYGRTVCSPLWVRKFLADYPQYRSVLHYERGWGGRQDVIAMVKEF